MDIKDRVKQEATEVASNDLLGAKEWKRSKISWLTGAGVIGDSIGSFKNQIGKSHAFVGSMARQAFGIDKAPPLPTESDDEVERFTVAERFYDTSPAELYEIQKFTHYSFLLYVLTGFVLLALAAVSFKIYTTPLPLVVDIFSRFALVPALIALAAKNGFYNWQVRNRRLGSFKNWIQQPLEWWSVPPNENKKGNDMTRTMRHLGIFLALGATALILSAGPALAQTTPSPFSTPPQTDLWMKTLQQIFPNIGPLSGGGTTTTNALASAFGAFLSVLLALSSAYLSWAILYGLVQTAHEGKVLGQRWHQIWAPIRVLTGVGMLAPVIKGFCIAQILVIYVAVWGGSIANVVWAAYVNALTVPTFDQPNIPQTMDLARDTGMIETCWWAVTTQQQIASTRSGPAVVAIPSGGLPVNASRPVAVASNPYTALTAPSAYLRNIIGWNPSPGNPVQITWDYGSCGTISGVFTSSTNGTPSYDDGMKTAFETFRSAASNTGKVVGQSISVAQPVTQDQINASVQSLIQAKAAFDIALLADVQTSMAATNSTTLSNFATQATDAGWVSAGSFYMTLSAIQAQVLGQVKNLPAVNLGSADKISDASLKIALFGTTDAAGQSTGKGALGSFSATWAKVASGGAGVLDAESALAAQEPDTGWSFTGFMNWIFIKLHVTRSLINWFSVTPGSGAVLQHMEAFGQTILDIFYAVIALSVMAKIGGTAAGILKTIPGVGAVAGGVVKDFALGASSVLMTLAIGLFAVGVVHAYILPMIPYVLFLFFTMGMLVLTAEGVVAACLWAFMHVRMDGSDFVDQMQRPGYMILFNLLFRATFALFGLYLSIQVFEAMIGLMNVTFYPAVLAALGDSGAGFVGTIVMILIMCYLHYQLAMRCFHLITQVPDRVTRWFGSSPDGMNEEQNTREAAGFIISRTESATQSGLQNALASKRNGPRPGQLDVPTSKGNSGTDGGGLK